MKKIIFIIMCCFISTACSNSPAKVTPIYQENEIIKISKGTLIYRNLNIGINEFYISKFPVAVKEWNEIFKNTPDQFKTYNDYEYVTTAMHKTPYLAIAKYCNEVSLKENLIPYYEIKSSKVIEIPANNGYRLPCDEEIDYIKSNGTMITLSAISFDTELTNGNILESTKLPKNSAFSFRIARNIDSVTTNTKGLEYATNINYDDDDVYYPFNDTKNRISFLIPKNWGLKGLKKGINIQCIKGDTSKNEENIYNEDSQGLVSYYSMYNNKYLYNFKYYCLNNFYDTKELEKKTDKEFIVAFSKYLGYEENLIRFKREKDKLYFTIFEPEKNLINYFIYLNKPKGESRLFYFGINAINKKSEIPSKLVDKIFKSINIE